MYVRANVVLRPEELAAAKAVVDAHESLSVAAVKFGAVTLQTSGVDAPADLARCLRRLADVLWVDGDDTDPF